MKKLFLIFSLLLATQVTSAQNEYNNALKQAADYIAKGQIGRAQSLINEELKSNPNNGYAYYLAFIASNDMEENETLISNAIGYLPASDTSTMQQAYIGRSYLEAYKGLNSFAVNDAIKAAKCSEYNADVATLLRHLFKKIGEDVKNKLNFVSTQAVDDKAKWHKYIEQLYSIYSNNTQPKSGTSLQLPPSLNIRPSCYNVYTLEGQKEWISIAASDYEGDVAGKGTIDDLKSTTTASEDEDSKIYTIVESPATYPGGVDALLYFINTHLKYPFIAQEIDLQGKVVLKFVVLENGKVGQVEVVQGIHPENDENIRKQMQKVLAKQFKTPPTEEQITQQIHHAYDQAAEAMVLEATRVIMSLPRFIPAKQEGKPVKSWFTIPINFTLI